MDLVQEGEEIEKAKSYPRDRRRSQSLLKRGVLVKSIVGETLLVSNFVSISSYSIRISVFSHPCKMKGLEVYRGGFGVHDGEDPSRDSFPG
jgi:hypothetical protein